ncbi:MAG: hypothetical protein V4735_05350 [Pseudomonadota bacterium]
MADEKTREQLEATKRSVLALRDTLRAADNITPNGQLSPEELLQHSLRTYQAQNANQPEPFKPLLDDLATIKKAKETHAQWMDKNPKVTEQMDGEALVNQAAAMRRLGDFVNKEPKRIANALTENASYAQHANNELNAQEAKRALAAQDRTDAARERAGVAGQVAKGLGPMAKDPAAAAMLELMRNSGEGAPSPEQAAVIAQMMGGVAANMNKEAKRLGLSQDMNAHVAGIPIGGGAAAPKANPNAALEAEILDIRKQVLPYTIEMSGKQISLDALEGAVRKLAGQPSASKNQR